MIRPEIGLLIVVACLVFAAWLDSQDVTRVEEDENTTLCPAWVEFYAWEKQ